jgi:two-component system phosphate regulon sensor histidine kinase PhoR
MTFSVLLVAAALAVWAALLWNRVRYLTAQSDRMDRTITRQAHELNQLRRDNDTLLERLPDPLVVLDPSRRIAGANAAARAAYGTDMPAALRHPDLRAAIDRAFTSGIPHTASVSLPVPIPREVDAAVVPLDPSLASGGRALVVLADRTRDRAVERMRADFVANASHELRTPLASLIGFIETLRGPAADDPPAQARFLGIMAEQAARMNRLIDDLLSLSRVEIVEHQPPSGSVDLADLVNRLAAGFEPRLTAAGMTLELAVVSGLPRTPGDADQLAQVVQNLLDNAVKYGRTGAVRLTLEAADADARFATRPGVVLTVADQGPGIPAHHLPRLTERFYRVNTHHSRAAGGTGLGLAIVKHIVNRHRGQLVIESEQGAGTKITIWLPIARQTA